MYLEPPSFHLNANFYLQDDDSLRRWKEKLLGCLESDLNGLLLAFSYAPDTSLFHNIIVGSFLDFVSAIVSPNGT